MKVTLLMPTLNEIEGMKAISPRIKREWVDEIVVVDGGSTDGTVDYAKKQGFRVIMEDKDKRGEGTSNSYKEAMAHITSDIVITFSPDGNSVPENIPPLVEKMKEGYDMVIVSRHLDGAKSEDDDIVTAFGNWMFTKMINILFGGHYTDTLVIFRAWKTELFRDCDANVHPKAGYDLYMSIYCAKNKKKVGEIPGDEPKRVGGERKMNPLINGFGALRLICMEIFK
jgi:glycosyltransferase involved in cell wall biosynthesis